MTVLVDSRGQPLRKELLTRDIAGPTLAGVLQPVTGYPGDGLTPLKLARILREADQGDPLSYFELAEQIEERDLHYSGVLATRKRSVSQVDVTVEAASDGAEDVKRADMVRAWLMRDELADETFDMLDAIGKGVSFTEIVWDTSEGQYQPSRLEWRDPRWFRFDRDGVTPLLRGGEDGASHDSELPAFKFIRLAIKAKSGLQIRSGLARLAAWSWMFKAYTQRDWAIFTQTYGQPVRIGKYHAGATDEDKNTLFRAVANIAGDCAAIVPQEMQIEFIAPENLSSSELYEKRSDWLDRQVSKAVLGQTNTTDAQAGGLGSAQANVHNDVRQDIETADCKALSAVLNRDLIRTWCDLEYGPGGPYPRVIIARPKQEDLKLLADSMSQLVPIGLEVSQSEIRDKFGLSEPRAGDKILHRAPAVSADLPALPAPGQPASISLHHSTGAEPKHPAERIASQMANEGDHAVVKMAETIEAMLAKASDLGEFQMMLQSAYGEIDSRAFADILAGGLAAARAVGRSDVAAESE